MQFKSSHVVQILIGFITIAIIGAAALADNSQPRPQLHVPEAKTPPRVDASKDDPAWAAAALIPSLSVSLGKPGQGVAPVPTQVRVLWDADWLYIRFTCTASEIYSPFTHHGDKLYQGDVVEVFLDPKGDGKQWLEVEVSPNNVTMEVQTTLTADPKSDADLKLTREIIEHDWWNNVNYTLEGLRSAASVNKDGDKITGWTVDIAVPARALTHRLGATTLKPGPLRANFMRYEYPKPNTPAGKRSLIAMNWSPVDWGCPHISPAAMGYLILEKR